MTLRAEHESLTGYLESVLDKDQLARPLLTNFNHWNFIQNAMTEVALTLHEHGSEVTIAFWADKTPMLDVAWESSRAFGTLLMSPTREQQIERALQASGVPDASFAKPPIKRWSPAEEIALPKLLNRTSIRAMTYRGVNMGRAILQVHPDRDTPITDEHLWPHKWVSTAARSFAYVYDQTLTLLENKNISFLAVFNGRFLHDRAAAAAAETFGIPVVSYDLGGLQTNFDLTIDDTHDWESLQRRMLSLYEKWDPSERDELGSSWFIERTQHLDPLNTLFVEAQKIGSMIELPQGKKVVAYFSSSGDEIIELDLDWDSFFGGQEQALRLVAEICAEDPDTILIVRSHPHKRHKPRLDVKTWIEAVEQAEPDIHLDPYSDVDSYTLMRRADVVVTYGSTSGIEAAFAGKPVIVMGPSAYNILGAATQVSTEDELRRAMHSPVLGKWESAVAFGLLMKRRGFNFSSIEKSSNDDITFHGHTIRNTPPTVAKLSDLMRKIQRRPYLRTK